MKKLLLCVALLLLLCGCEDASLVQDGLQYTLTDTEAILTHFRGGTQSVRVPDTVQGLPVTRIGEGAFASARALTDVSLPESLTTIDSYAFAKCTALVSVTFRGALLTDIGPDAFAKCKALETIHLPMGVARIGSNAFSDCTLLSHVYLPGTLTSLGDHAFDQCHALTGLQLPPSLTELGQNIFSGCPVTLTVFEDSEGLAYAQAYGIPFEVED